MSDLLLLVHGFLRWPTLVLGVGGFIVAASAWSRGVESRLAKGVGAAFVGALDLQFVLGVLILLVVADARGTGWQHAAVMAVAAAIATTSASARSDFRFMRHAVTSRVCSSSPWS